jgi:hypothetical protein
MFSHNLGSIQSLVKDPHFINIITSKKMINRKCEICYKEITTKINDYFTHLANEHSDDMDNKYQLIKIKDPLFVQTILRIAEQKMQDENINQDRKDKNFNKANYKNKDTKPFKDNYNNFENKKYKEINTNYDYIPNQYDEMQMEQELIYMFDQIILKYQYQTGEEAYNSYGEFLQSAMDRKKLEGNLIPEDLVILNLYEKNKKILITHAKKFDKN